MTHLLADPYFYLAAIPAVVLIGLSKGGLGGAMALIGVPLLSLVVPPLQAAAILLPILIVMDWVSLWTWRGYYDMRTIRIMLPGAVAGIGIGWLTATVVTEGMVRLIIGLIAFLFVLRWVVQKLASGDEAKPHKPLVGVVWGVAAGFTSFVAHAGGPPFQVYALPLKQHPRVFTGTAAIFFAVVNAVKVVPYFALGQFDATNLEASLFLIPFAPLATLAGAWVVKRMRPQVFYPFMYVMILVVSLDLMWTGISDIGGW